MKTAEKNISPQEPGNFSTSITHDGFAFVPAAEMQDALIATGPLADWIDFAASWNDLAEDTYMADKGRYRKRRYAVYSAQNETIARQEHQPHYQTTDYNPLNGGVERWFEPILPEIGNSLTLETILEFCNKLFTQLADPSSPVPRPPSWHIEVHQFRIEAKEGEVGQPTPEGMHRDGVDYALVLLVRRENIASGTTNIQDLEKNALESFTLTDPLDAAIVDDHRVMHGVTPVTPLDPAKPAYRDVLVVTFKKKVSD